MPEAGAGWHPSDSNPPQHQPPTTTDLHDNHQRPRRRIAMERTTPHSRRSTKATTTAKLPFVGGHRVTDHHTRHFHHNSAPAPSYRPHKTYNRYRKDKVNTMYIRDNGPYKYGGFEINPDAIGNRTIKQNEIVFPFTGDLPLPYKTATISFVVSPETCMISITAERDDKPPKTYFVEADKEEVEDILHSFFYTDLEEICISREDNGLSAYWNGALQTEYDAWCNISREPERVIAILQQLTVEQRRGLYQDFHGMEAEDNRAGDPHD